MCIQYFALLAVILSIAPIALLAETLYSSVFTYRGSGRRELNDYRGSGRLVFAYRGSCRLAVG